MFIGQFEHSVDEKGRLAFPAKFRKNLQGGAVVTKGLDGCLFVFSKEKFIQMAESIDKLPYTKSSVRLYSRLILANASEVEFDKQGRAILPAHLKIYAKLEDRAVVTGLFNRIEIWSADMWEKEMAKTEKDAGKVVEELSDLES